MRRWTLAGQGLMLLLILLPLLGIGIYAAWLTLMCAPLEKVPSVIPGLSIFALCVLTLILLGTLQTVMQPGPRSEIPPGLEVLPNEAPALFQELESIRRQTGAAPFDGVLLSAECGACVSIGPRPGVKGKRRYLVLGMPLLTALSPESVRAVLSHEISHRKSGWLEHNARRVERWLRKLVPETGVRCRARGVLDAPLTWFAPRFRAVWLAFGRAQEITADANAARVAGAAALAYALKTLAILDRLHSTWLDELIRAGWQEPEPPVNLCERWTQAVAGCPQEKAAEWLERALREPTFKHQTHPSLRERLRALGGEVVGGPTPALPATSSAFTAWCADAVPAVQRKFDLWWSGTLGHWWSGARQTLMDCHALLGTDARQDEFLSPEERVERAWQHASSVLQCHGAETAEPLILELLKTDPTHPHALQWHIKRRLERGDLTAQSLIPDLPQFAVQEELWLSAAAAQAIRGNLEGEFTALRQADLAADRRCLGPTGMIRKSLAGAMLEPHDLTAEQIALIAERASVQPWIDSVAIACLKAVPPETRGRPIIAVRVRVRGGQPRAQPSFLVRNTMHEALKAARLRRECEVHVCLPKDLTLALLLFRLPQTIIYDRRTAIR